MNVQELLQRTPFEDVWDSLNKAFYQELPDWQARELEVRGISKDAWIEHIRESYESMVAELRCMPLVLPERRYVLVAYPPFAWAGEDGPRSSELDQFLVIPGADEHYGLTGIPWGELVACEVYGKSLEAYGAAAVVANLIYEMAFDGFTSNQAMEAARKLADRLKESESEIAEGRTVSLEDLYERGVFERPSEEELRKLEEQRKIDAANMGKYRLELEAFLAELHRQS